jgi:pimeloyl-ACP methyl ester carboxylesterase
LYRRQLAILCASVVLAASAAQADGLQPSGERVDIGGRSLHVICRGPKSTEPLVLLDAGMYGAAAGWDAVQDALASQGLRSCAWDRAGMGFSDPGPLPRDAEAMVADLKALLEALHEPGPYVLVGHSLAGIQSHLFAVRERERVAGLVLVDATSPQIADTRGGRSVLAGYPPLVRMMRLLDGLGLARMMARSAGDQIGLEGPAHDEVVRIFGMKQHQQTSRQELEALPASVGQARAAGPLDPALPVVAIESGRSGRLHNAWARGREAEADASRRGRVISIDGASHAGLLGPDYAEAIAGVVKTLILTKPPG